MREPQLPTILIVDDQPPNITALRAILAGGTRTAPDGTRTASAGTRRAGAGYRIVTATDGVQALEVAAAESPDVILMDVKMPNMDGIEACKKLKSTPT